MQLDLIRHMPPSKRALKALRLTARLIRECKSAIARNNPGLTPREIGIAFIELNYGQELAAAVERTLGHIRPILAAVAVGSASRLSLAQPSIV